ncbi:MAG: YwqG family protein [Betaproteobacteria bacterium]|nr:YwqG family protein [Betaproteobacteria bacterium]
MFHTKSDIRDRLIDVGVSDANAVLLAQQAKPAVWLETSTVKNEAEIAIGATKLGGLPDLPAGVAWPMRPIYPDAEARTKFIRADAADPDRAWRWATPEQREEFRQDTLTRIQKIESAQPLSFIAQINLAEMWAAGSLDPDIPRQGVLSIFYDFAGEPSGFDPQDRVGFAILFHDAGALTRSVEPGELRNDFYARYRLSPLACGAHACMTPLPHVEAEYERMGLPEEVMNMLDGWWDEDDFLYSSQEDEDWKCHRIGGWPTPVQDGMQTQCALVHAGHHCGAGESYKDPVLASIRATATDWLLLAQIGADEKGNMNWGDNGQIYVWIRRDDLKARRFENAWLILQSY